MTPPVSPVVVWTIGHSTRPLDALIDVLRVHGIEVLADVRTLPRSRVNPQFDQDTLPAVLGAHGIVYVHLPELGGWRRPLPGSTNTAWRNASFRGFADYMRTPAFERALEALVERAAGARTAAMCSEAVPWRCHRALIADALVARGVEVRHILGPEPTEPHVMTRFARVTEGRVTYPAAGPGGQLDLDLG